jgi:NADH-quinone oxidoreductase subunit F
MRAVSDGLRTPLADLYGTVTFYHHFSRVPGGQEAPRICDGPVCCLHGSEKLIEAMRPQGATPMPCSGRCDGPVPVLKGNETWIATPDASADTGFRLERDTEGSPLPPVNPGGTEECVFAKIREPGRTGIEGYRAGGGYLGLARALELGEEKTLDLISDSGLAGRGGAGFPTGRKWRAVYEAPGDPKTIVCNADEGEPGCFKDRALMDHDPHALIEGMAIAAMATGATRGFIYLRYEYPETDGILQRALDEAEAAGMIGAKVAGSDRSFKLEIRRGAGAYICGEETSLLNSLEGKHPFPRNRPPFPVTHGYEDKPTAVNNVETLCGVPMIMMKGAEWYRGLGMSEHAGTKVISLSGDVKRPGNYEVPIGFPLKTLLYDWAGGPAREGTQFAAATMAGLSGGFIGAGDIEDATLDEPCLRAKGSFLGAGGIMVFDDTRDMVDIARQAMSFFAHESCGKCFPCRIGTQRLTERLAGAAGPGDLVQWTDEMKDLGEVMKSTSACGLGMAAPLVVESLIRLFPEEVARHVAAQKD